MVRYVFILHLLEQAVFLLLSMVQGLLCNFLLYFLTKLDGCPRQINILERCLLMSQWNSLLMLVLLTILANPPSSLVVMNLSCFVLRTDSRSVLNPSSPILLKPCGLSVFLSYGLRLSCAMVSLKHLYRLLSLNLGIILIQLLNFRLLISSPSVFLVLWTGRGLRESLCMQNVNSPGSYLFSAHSSRQCMILLYPIIQSSITSSMLELPFPKLQRNGKSSCRESTQLRKTFTSPVVDQYEKVAAKYRSYINELSPKIEVVYEKENFRNYLNEQKLNVIKSQLMTKKEVLQRQLEDKMDPAKSPNGKLHTEIISLTELEANYSAILADIEKNAKEKEREIGVLGQMVGRQKEIIKGLLKYDFKHSKETITYKLPKIYRNASETSFLSRDSKSVFRHSRESIISKLSSGIMSRTNDRVNLEEERIIMLKLFLVYAHSETEQNELSSKVMEALEKELVVREGVVKEIKAELSAIETETRVNMTISIE